MNVDGYGGSYEVASGVLRLQSHKPFPLSSFQRRCAREAASI